MIRLQWFSGGFCCGVWATLAVYFLVLWLARRWRRRHVEQVEARRPMIRWLPEDDPRNQIPWK